MKQAVFTVDVATCTGCFTCSVACKDRAGLPDDLDLLRVERFETGRFPQTGLYFRVIHCFHCAAPACADVCPSQAISRGEDGLVAIDEEPCSRCGKCAEACPFEAIVIQSNGEPVKCDGCADEIAMGWDPTCVRACPMRALSYGSADEMPFENRLEDDDFDDKGMGPAVRFLRRKNSA